MIPLLVWLPLVIVVLATIIVLISLPCAVLHFHHMIFSDDHKAHALAFGEYALECLAACGLFLYFLEVQMGILALYGLSEVLSGALHK